MRSFHLYIVWSFTHVNGTTHPKDIYMHFVPIVSVVIFTETNICCTCQCTSWFFIFYFFKMVGLRSYQLPFHSRFNPFKKNQLDFTNENEQNIYICIKYKKYSDLFDDSSSVSNEIFSFEAARVHIKWI